MLLSHSRSSKISFDCGFLWGLFGSQIMFFSAMTWFFPNTYAFGVKGIDPRKKEICKQASLDMENLEKHLFTMISANITLKIHSPSKRSGTKILWWWTVNWFNIPIIVWEYDWTPRVNSDKLVFFSWNCCLASTKNISVLEEICSSFDTFILKYEKKTFFFYTFMRFEINTPCEFPKPHSLVGGFNPAEKY